MMIGMKKEKILTTLVLVVVLTLLVGSVYSLATDDNTGPVTITAGNRTNNTDAETDANINGTVSATNTNNTNSNNTNTNSNNTSNYNSISNSASLPKAGTSSSIVFIVIGFVVSAIYAYKKVTDYNL